MMSKTLFGGQRLLVALLVCFLTLIGLNAIAGNTLDGLGLNSSVTGVRIYSVRKLSSNYSGPAVRVRNGNNGAEGDVAFDAYGKISASSNITITFTGSSGYLVSQVISFATFYSGATIYVNTWYDQSGNGANATQTTASNQPNIVNAGVLNIQNGQTTIIFGGGSQGLTATGYSTAFDNSNGGTLCTVGRCNAESRWQGLAQQGRENATAHWGIWSGADNLWTIGTRVNNSYINIPSSVQSNIFCNLSLIQTPGNTTNLYLKGTSIGSTSSRNLGNGSSFTIGYAMGVSESWSGPVSEVLLFPVGVNTSTQSIIENNEQNFFTLGTSLTCSANSSTTNFTICNTQLPYIWNGLTFNAAGSQTAHLSNVGGCDSLATLNLTVNSVTYVGNITGSSSLCTSTTTTLSTAGLSAPTGGTITTSGIYRIHTFKSSGTFTVPSGFSLPLEVLVVAGGGAGGGNGGGGGGAGGVVYNSNYTLSGSSATVTIGAGGTPPPDGYSHANNGGNSVFATITAIGGGGGATRDGGGGGVAGGSGGGGAGTISGLNDNVSGSGTSGQGNSGGAGTPDYNCYSAGGGGGGSYTAGSPAGYQTGGKGGDGLNYSISGTAVTYAAGGGGGITCSGYNVGQGGSNIGGKGGSWDVSATSGAANTGSGGGGNGGYGGSGIVIVRYVAQQDYSAGTWSSSNNAVATISNSGVVTGISTGSVLINKLSGCSGPTPFTVTINTASTSSTNLSICSTALPYTWNGLTFNAAGSQTVHLTNSAGCDSAATLNLTINTGTFNATTQTACGSYTWHGTTYNSSGNYTYSYNNANGCASVDTLHLTINQPSTSTTNLSICSSQLPYTWNGLTFNTAGSQTANLTNSVGCDSLATLNLTLKASTVITSQPTDYTSCLHGNAYFAVSATGTSLSYAWQGASSGSTNYQSSGASGGAFSGTFTDTLKLTNLYSMGYNGYHVRCIVSGACGVDTTNLVLLTVYSALTVTTNPANKSVCTGSNATFTTVASGSGISYQWKESSDGGNSYQDINNNSNYSGATTASLTVINPGIGLSGNKYYCYVTSSTCGTSTNTTAATLTVKQPTTATITISACTSYKWHGNTYTTSGTHTFDSLNAVGCDSLTTLILTINHPSTSTTTITNCGSYTWNGQTYTTSGTYTKTFIGGNSNGCDSVATLNLTVSAANTWTGATSTDWNTASNWACGTVPASGADITINTSTNYPSLSGATIVGSLNFASGSSLNLNSNSLNIGGTISGSGLIKGSSSSSLTYSSNTNSTINFGTSGTDSLLANLTVSGTGTLTIGSGLGITGTLSVNSGTLATGNHLTLTSTSIANTAVVGAVTGTITGKVTVERFIPKGLRAFRDLAAGVANAGSIFNNWQEGGNYPVGYGIYITGVKGAAPGGVDANTGLDKTLSGNPSLYSYGSGSWPSVTNTKTTNLDPFMGYRASIRGDRTYNIYTPDPTAMVSATTLRATGNLVTGNVLYTTSNATSTAYTSTAAKLVSGTNNYSFVANPYVCPIDWEAVYANAGTQNISSSYWYFDPTFLSGGNATYVTYNAVSHINSNPSASKLTRYIQSGMAFFVQNTGSTPALSITESNKAANSTKTAVFRAEAPNYLHASLWKNVKGVQTNIDGTVATFNSNFTKVIGDKDSKKISNGGENIFITQSNTDLSIAGLPVPTENEEIALNLNQLVAGTTYQLQLDVSQFTTTSVDVFIKDKLLNTIVPAADGISFTATKEATTYEGRFSIVFKANKVNPIIVKGTVSIYPNPVTNSKFNLQMSNMEKGTYTVKAINNLGQVVLNTTIINDAGTTAKTITVKGLVAGVYTVQVLGKTGSYTTELIINK